MSTQRTVSEIAREIIETWWINRAKKYTNKTLGEWRDVVYFGAVPYLEAMLTLRSQAETPNYGLDSLDSIILYGLSNMSAFRGPRARALKEELRGHLSRSYGK